jgi:hypothetical protein
MKRKAEGEEKGEREGKREEYRASSSPPTLARNGKII